MARVTVEDCLDHINNRFALVILASQRARQLLKGAKPTVEHIFDDPIKVKFLIENQIKKKTKRCAETHTSYISGLR